MPEPFCCSQRYLQAAVAAQATVAPFTAEGNGKVSQSSVYEQLMLWKTCRRLFSIIHISPK